MNQPEQKSAEDTRPDHPPEGTSPLLADLFATNQRLLKIAARLEENQLREMLFLYKHPFQLIWINFLAGLSRGLGLTVGTALFLAFAAYFLGQFISLPLIGEYIAKLLDIVDTYRSGTLPP